jgi:hypothetical protein
MNARLARSHRLQQPVQVENHRPWFIADKLATSIDEAMEQGKRVEPTMRLIS